MFGFGQGPFNIKVNFIDPDDPASFSPVALPTDLGGNQVQNFTFVQTFDTQFDPSTVNTNLIREPFTSLAQRAAPDPNVLNDAIWGDDSSFPFQLVSQAISTRIAQADVVAITSGGAVTEIDNPPVANPSGSAPGNEDYCPTAYPLVGPDLTVNAGPPTSAGRRQHNLYRRAELGANGTVIRVAWGPDSDATFAATYSQFNMRIGHKRALTSLTAGSLFSQFDVDGFVQVVTNVQYKVPQAADINGAPINNGYLDWPQFNTFFEYDGVNELLIDIEAQEGNTYQTFRTFLAVSKIGGSLCNCTTIFAGACNINNSAGFRQTDTAWGSDIPNPSTSAAAGIFNPSPFVHVMEFELAKLRSDAQSKYYDSGTPNPDFLTPIINPLVQSGGATIVFTWSASDDGIEEAVPFTPNINSCDGHRYIRWHAVLRSNLFTGARARCALLELPYTFE